MLAAALAFVGSEPRTARACTPIESREVVLTPSADTVAPTLAVLDASVARGDGTCEGSGAVALELATSDDQTAPAEMAYQVTVVRSDGARLLIPTTPFYQPFNQPGRALSLLFADHGQAIDVSLQVSAVDRSGNVSAPVTVDVADSGAGCSVGGGAGWLAALALAPLVRRRRRR